MTDSRSYTNMISQTISFLRFPLIVAVVYIHFNISRKGISVHGINYGTDNPDWYYFTINLVSSVIASIAVPLFFFISGYLFFFQKEFNRREYLLKLQKRIKTLLIPYLLWNLIAIIFQVVRLIPFFSSIFPGAYKSEIHLSFIRVFNTFFNNTDTNGIIVCPIEYTMTEIINEPFPIDIPLWYIRDLMVMIIISPIIYWMIKKFHVWYVVGLCVIWYLGNLIIPDGGYIHMLFTSTFFFSWGSTYSIMRIDFVETMQKVRYLTILYIPIAIFDTQTLFTEYNIYIHKLGILFGIIAVINIASQIVKSGKVTINHLLLNSTFFIFALHKLIIDDVAKVVFSLLHLPDSTFVMFTLYVVIPLITICVCVLLYKLIKQRLPFLCFLLTGGR